MDRIVDGGRAGDRSPGDSGRSVRRWWPLLAVALLGLLTAMVVADPDPLPGEISYVSWLQRVGEPVPTVAELVRATTGTEAAVVLVLVSTLAWMSRSPELRSTLGRAALIALIVMLVVQPVFKDLVDRPRPTAAQVEVRAEHSSTSFPSGHSMSTTTIWGAAIAVAWHHRRRLLAGVAAIPIGLTGLASGVQGVHWPSDVVAGTLAGAVAAWSIVWTLRRGGAGRMSPPRRSDPEH